jgi:UDP-glucose 4-epimerase
MSILVTGGAGYIGSHAVQRLLAEGHRVLSVDNLFRGHREAMDNLAKSAGDRLTFVCGDVGDRDLMTRLIEQHRIQTVMHFAALAYVGESVNEPLRYYRANTAAALGLLEAVDASHRQSHGGVTRFVFSSTCASYGEPARDHVPIRETCPQLPINPYGWSKLHTERMLKDYAHTCQATGKPFALACLRYFNVAGSDPAGIIGEHHEPETHVIPVALQAVLGQREAFTVFGTDYPTPDGTCIRDYVHVVDLIDAHIAVMKALTAGDQRVYNLGIGNGFSVRQVLDSVKRVTGKEFKIKEGPRRPGDPPELFADPRKIREEIGWTAKYTDLDSIVATAWNWFKAHPRGYAG